MNLSVIVIVLLVGLMVLTVLTLVYKMQNRLLARQNELTVLQAQLEAERKYAQMAKQDREVSLAKQLELMQAQFETASQRVLKERSEELKGVNKEAMDRITAPFLKEIEELRKSVSDSKSGNDKNMSALEATIKTVMERSEQMSKDARNLADALKNHGKVQGDWGEQVLVNILNESGLREGYEYVFQEADKDDEGNDLRPDVIVHCADGTNVIVDSKVSLTAYTKYVGAADEAERESACKENLNSIWSHVKELSGKYNRVVDNTIPKVLMFVPNEGSYILALNSDPQIGQKAFQKGVIIINPTNLMLALNLILVTWRNTRQEDNCREILKTAEGLYEKFCGFTDTFVKVGSQFATAQKSYDEALGQLKNGRGNISNRFNDLLQLGVNSPKKINAKVSSKSDGDMALLEE